MGDCPWVNINLKKEGVKREANWPEPGKILTKIGWLSKFDRRELRRTKKKLVERT